MIRALEIDYIAVSDLVTTEKQSNTGYIITQIIDWLEDKDLRIKTFKPDQPGTEPEVYVYHLPARDHTPIEEPMEFLFDQARGSRFQEIDVLLFLMKAGVLPEKHFRLMCALSRLQMRH